MVLDYHLHVWPHGTTATPLRVEQIREYCDRAAARGVTRIALTEHLNRFHQAAPLDGFWDDEPDPAIRSCKAQSWRAHAAVDLDQYVQVVLDAQAEGLPVALGLEVDHYAGRMDTVARILDGYPFDVLLGSVHWIGAWGFDMLDTDVMAAEWDRRDVEDVWRAYTEAMEELAASGVCDVLAHPDLPKLTGRRPAVPEDLYDRMAEAARASGMAAEVNTAGWRRPVGEVYPAPALLERFRRAGVPVTTASDAHTPDLVADRTADAQEAVRAAGYTELTAFRRRQSEPVPLAAATGAVT